MKEFIVIALLVVLTACGNVGRKNPIADHSRNASKIVAVGELPSQLGMVPMDIDLVKGKFEYFFGNQESGMFKSIFVTQENNEMPLMRYLAHTSMSISDTLQVSENRIILPVTYKMDPNSIKVYRLKNAGVGWILLTGKAPSASGRGARKMFYTLISSPDNELYSLLSSALGDALHFGYCEKSGELLFIELTNSTERVDSYAITIKDIKGKSVGEVLDTELKYNMRDSLVYSGELQTVCSSSTYQE